MRTNSPVSSDKCEDGAVGDGEGSGREEKQESEAEMCLDVSLLRLPQNSRATSKDMSDT